MTLVMLPNFGRVIEQAFNRTDRFRELEERSARLENYQAMQHKITQIIARSVELGKAIPHIIQVICEATAWDFGEVWQVDRTTDTLFCDLSWHSPSVRFPAFGSSGQTMTFARGKGLPGRVWTSGKPAWMTNVVADSHFLRGSLAEQDDLHGALGVPIRTEGEVIGVLTLFSRQTRQPDRELLRVLDTIGSQIGLFIERKEIDLAEREQSRMLAAMEERQRIARDLHDSVTQTLFSASVIAEMLPVMWDRNPEAVRPGLTEIHNLTRGALAEMRTLLVELRPTAAPMADLGELLKNLVDGISGHTKTQVSLSVNGTFYLASDAQLALYRITQEALNNIVKHAGASHAWIELCSDANHIELHISDDGYGFEMANIPADHFGLGIMGERAAAIGAKFRIHSTPGYGTQLNVTFPLTIPRTVKQSM